MSMFDVIVFASKISFICGIWPPPFTINFNQHETFIIGDDIQNDELIQDNELSDFKLHLDERKFERLHKIVKKFDETDNNPYFKQNKVILDDNIYEDEIKIGEIGFISDKNDIKREDDDYNYEELHKQYIDLIKTEVKSNITFNSTSYDEHETMKDALGKIVDFKSTPRNCTAEELNGIGYGAVKCVWLDLKHSETNTAKINTIYRAKKIFLIWLIIYLLVSIVCWCQKGWCCCCCRCKFCRPLERINETKTYFMNNPPGIYINPKNETLNYTPSIYEINAYKKLEKTLMTL